MSMTAVNRIIFNLDMVNFSNIKRNGLLLKKTIVYVNSALFLERKFYILQIKNVKYETEGLLEQAWKYISLRKYEQAEDLFDKILSFSQSSYKTYFGKFIVCLFQNKDAYQYLKRTVETKNDSLNDDYYRIYVNLYNELVDIDDDYLPLLELLKEPKKIVAFNKNSYNGRFLDFLNNLENKQYESAKKNLDKCLEMKQDLYLDIIKYLLDKVINYKKELVKAYEKQEMELEKQRAISFSQAVKNKDLSEAKKRLQSILSFRNKDNKDNYIYYLFLELIETIELADNDITFEIMPVNYKYTDKGNALHTFYEAISAGDFKTALEFGFKCRNKVLDPKQNIIKVNLYVILLQMLYDKFEERQNNIDILYQTLIGNIEKGNYKHALNLYNSNATVLKEYNSRLVNYLFNRLMGKPIEEYIIEEKVEDIIDDSDSIKDSYDNASEDITLELEKTTSEDKTSNASEEIKANSSLDAKPLKITKPLNNKVTIFLRHNEPNNEYFQKYQICLVNKKYEEAKIWLDRFAEVLYSNNIRKRLDYYYYQINLGILENSHPEEVIYRRKQVYFLAYNDILEGKYEEALSYLNYYVDTDQDNDIRGYLLLGRLYTLMKQNNKAIECYIKANAIAPSPDAYYFLGDLYYKRHKWADAVFCYLTYNEFYPKENPMVYLNLSECYKQLNKSDKVVKYLRIADEINVEQKRGLYLKDRILKAEMIDKKKREHFLLDKENKGNTGFDKE